VFSRADAVFAVAEGVRADLVEGFDAPPERVRVLHNPLDVEGIRRAAREPLDDADPGGDRPSGEAEPADGEPPATPVVVGVGRLVRLKGFDVLLRALPRMRSGARLILVGDGPERPALEALVRDLGVESRVRFTGERPNPWSQMARADVLALPSRSEAFPTVVGEALALGVPVVAAEASPGVREYLEGGRCGVLVPPDDPAALAAGLDRVLDDRVLARELADRGRARVEAFADGRVEAYGRALLEVMGR
jgi:glycosyltransferase involved in cell wall biosynthesis